MAKLLDLSTLTEHDTVAINGTEYELVRGEELSILDYHRVAKWGAVVGEMQGRIEDLSEEQLVELSKRLDALCRLTLRAPDDVHARLTETQRLEIISCFTSLQRKTAPAAGEEKAPTVPPETVLTSPLEHSAAAPVAQPDPSTGENSSPA